MKIAQVAPLWFRIPPRKYGGAEMSIYLLTEALVKRGHEVTLFASGNSVTSAKLEAVVNKPLRESFIDWSDPHYTTLNIYRVIKNHYKFDVINFHLTSEPDYYSFPMSDLASTKTFFTLRVPLPKAKTTLSKYQLFKNFSHLNFISLSKAQQKSRLRLNWVANIGNAVDIHTCRYNSRPNDYFIWVGNVRQEKGTHLAIKAAKKARVRLLLIGPVDKSKQDFYQYWQTKVKPLIDNRQIVYLGECTRAKTINVMRKARGLLMPIQWEEPFGRVIIEALATGTPVIAFRRGSVPEIIKNGLNGFIVNDVNGIVKAIKKIDQVNRIDCRLYARDNFSPEIIVRKYERLYNK